MSSKAERFWDGRAASYDSDTGEDGAQADPTLLGDIQPYLRPGDRLLDFGCATGTYTLAVATNVAAVEGRDISTEMIAIARQKAATQGVANAHFSAGPLDEAGYEAGSFDVVLALNVIHLLPDAAGTVAQLSALLSPGGRLITETPCLGQKRSVMGLFLRGLSKIGIVPHLSALSSADIDALVLAAGLRPTTAELRDGSVGSYFLVATR